MLLQNFQDLLTSHVTRYTGLTIMAAGYILISKLSRRLTIDNIPTAGSSPWVGSWVAAVMYLWNAHDVLQDGYKKYKGAPFKVSTLYFWMVVVTGRQYAEAFNKSREEELSFLEGVNMTLRAQYTFGHEVHFNPYHVRVLHSNLNRNLVPAYEDMRDEVVATFDELLNLDRHEWKAIPARDTMLKVIIRATTRIFVGLPLCRNPDWIDLNIRYATEIVLGRVIVNLFPETMSSFVVQYLTSIPKSIRLGVSLLSPVIEARRKHVKESGGSLTDGPNDLLTWLMQEAKGSQQETEDLVRRVMVVSFAGVHSTSNTFTQVLYNLAANPQYIQPLREEVEAIVKEDGWSRDAAAKMYKVDSFIKETQRTQAMTITSMVRVPMKDVTFSDGTTIPKGSYVVMGTQLMHLDEKYYDHPKVFDPFRFSRLRDPDDAGTNKHKFSATTPDYLAFGYGKHVCPARFFVSDQLTTMLAYIVVSYDVKLEGNAARPKNFIIGDSASANPKARVMFRKRV